MPLRYALLGGDQCNQCPGNPPMRWQTIGYKQVRSVALNQAGIQVCRFK
jgi:hypothetical protein